MHIKFHDKEARDAHGANMRAQLAAFDPIPAQPANPVAGVPYWIVVAVGALLGVVVCAAFFG